jgi:hypothetical protein
MVSQWASRLDLLRQCVNVTEVALKRALGEDRPDPGCFAGPVGDRDGARNRTGAGEPCPRAVLDVDRRYRTRPRIVRSSEPLARASMRRGWRL